VYKTLGFKWIFERSAPHQVRCNWTGKCPQSPTIYTNNRYGQAEVSQPNNKVEKGALIKIKEIN